MVSKAGANFVSQETYEMIKTGLGAPLTRDVLVYVTHLKGTPDEGRQPIRATKQPINVFGGTPDEGDRWRENQRRDGLINIE